MWLMITIQNSTGQRHEWSEFSLLTDSGPPKVRESLLFCRGLLIYSLSKKELMASYKAGNIQLLNSTT